MDAILMAWRMMAICIIVLVLIVLYCLMGFVSSAIAERRTARQIETHLPDDAEGLLSDLTLSVSTTGTTQIDHVLIASHGLYVIEQKNYAGKLYGKLEESHWRKWKSSGTLKLQNPFRQNYGHIRAIQSTLRASELECINVVIINGPCKFEGEKPDWLCMGMGEFIRKVTARRQLNVLKPEAVSYIRGELKLKRKPPGLYTDLHHIHNVTTRYNTTMRLEQRITYNLLRFIRHLVGKIFGSAK
ncbi:NERD domain-containing protein [Salmonella enterica]|nr:NERD domain-containing protein [Salmonella enterica]